MDDLKITEDMMCPTIPTEDFLWTTLATISGVILCIVYLIIILCLSLSLWKRYEEKESSDGLDAHLKQDSNEIPN